MQLETFYRIDGVHQTPQAIAGPIRQLAAKLYDELLTSGYSLLDSDVEHLALENVKIYTAWARLECQFFNKEQPKPDYFDLTLDNILTVDEWAIILPCVRSHCDIMQARRMEGSQALGVMPFGISSSEAMQNYNQCLEIMKKEAFCYEPFSIG